MVKVDVRTRVKLFLTVKTSHGYCDLVIWQVYHDTRTSRGAYSESEVSNEGARESSHESP